MKTAITRRQLLKLLTAAGFGTPLATRVVADQADAARQRAPVPENIVVPVKARDRYPARLVDGKVIQPERPLAVMHETDVLVVGGARRGICGGGGGGAGRREDRAGRALRLPRRPVDRRTGPVGVPDACDRERRADQGGARVGDDLLGRIARHPEAATNHAAGKPDPTTDPEITKLVMDEMRAGGGREAVVPLLGGGCRHGGNAVRGVVIESKAGRQAILARVVVDASGDGDVFAAAGAEHEQRLHAVGLVHRLATWTAPTWPGSRPRASKPRRVEPLPSVRWVNLRGPSTDGLDIAELSRLEVEHRRASGSGWSNSGRRPAATRCSSCKPPACSACASPACWRARAR